jgi:hypothetical protein
MLFFDYLAEQPSLRGVGALLGGALLSLGRFVRDELLGLEQFSLYTLPRRGFLLALVSIPQGLFAGLLHALVTPGQFVGARAISLLATPTQELSAVTRVCVSGGRKLSLWVLHLLQKLGPVRVCSLVLGWLLSTPAVLLSCVLEVQVA